jgi:hypothetical protein
MLIQLDKFYKLKLLYRSNYRCYTNYKLLGYWLHWYKLVLYIEIVELIPLVRFDHLDMLVVGTLLMYMVVGLNNMNWLDTGYK